MSNALKEVGFKTETLDNDPNPDGTSQLSLN
jgi:hypothetical protein